VAASIAIHALFVLWQMPLDSAPPVGERLVEIEMLPSGHHADAHRMAENVSPALADAVAKAPAGKTAAQDVTASASQVSRPAAPDAEAGQPDDGSAETAARVRRHLEAHKFYPASARRRGITGEVEVGFVLDRLGMAEKITVLAGSGHNLLDWAARETVRRAQPFPATERAFHFRLRFRKL